jgi:hypothetical protein
MGVIPRLFGGFRRSPTAQYQAQRLLSRQVAFTKESMMPHVTTDPQEHNLHVRIRAEFAEMPGLKLTLPQASRLFNIDAERCQRALDRLVQSGLLSIARGAFVRAGGA